MPPDFSRAAKLVHPAPMRRGLRNHAARPPPPQRLPPVVARPPRHSGRNCQAPGCIPALVIEAARSSRLPTTGSPPPATAPGRLAALARPSRLPPTRVRPGTPRPQAEGSLPVLSLPQWWI
jgi:hypothetical protein